MDAKELILKSCELPAVPMVAMRVLRLVDKADTTVDDMQTAIMADQALSARVLRMANSAFYGMRREIDTISDAILIMGFATIKNLALAVSTRGVYKNFGLLEQKLWEHSVGASIAAGLIARAAGVFKPEEAVMAGLLHDVGKVVMNNSQPDKFMLLIERVYEENATCAEIEQEIFGFGHAEVGWLFAQKWEFPEFLCNVIRDHHGCGGDEDRFCSIVSLADALCMRLGIGYRSPREDVDDTAVRKSLGISDGRYLELTEEFKRAYLEEKMQFQQ